MDTKTCNKRTQVLPRRGGLSGGVFKNFIPLLLYFFLNRILLPKKSRISPSPLKSFSMSFT